MYVRYIHLPPMRQSIYMYLVVMVIHWNIFYTHHLFPPGSVPGLIKTHHIWWFGTKHETEDGWRSDGTRPASLAARRREPRACTVRDLWRPDDERLQATVKMATISATGQGSQVSPLMRGTIHGLTESPPTSNSKYLLGVTQ